MEWSRDREVVRKSQVKIGDTEPMLVASLFDSNKLTRHARRITLKTANSSKTKSPPSKKLTNSQLRRTHKPLHVTLTPERPAGSSTSWYSRNQPRSMPRQVETTELNAADNAPRVQKPYETTLKRKNASSSSSCQPAGTRRTVTWTYASKGTPWRSCTLRDGIKEPRWCHSNKATATTSFMAPLGSD